jgi:hypothetical protein
MAVSRLELYLSKLMYLRRPGLNVDQIEAVCAEWIHVLSTVRVYREIENLTPLELEEFD